MLKIINLRKAIYLLIICAAVLFALPVYADTMMPSPQNVIQADGSYITIRAFGDEFFNWIEEDSTGYIIAYDAGTSNWCYAYIRDNEILPDKQSIVGSVLQPFSSLYRIKSNALKPLQDQIDYSIYDLLLC